MWYLVLSVLFNASLVLIFKYMGQLKVHNFTAIVVNYLTCFVVGSIYSGGQVFDIDSFQSNWLVPVLGIGTIFIVTFNIIALTVQEFSVTIATLAQKMSIIFVVCFAIFYFNERLNLLRVAGLACGIFSILLITGLSFRKKEKVKSAHKLIFLLPVLTFSLSGIVDSSFMYFDRVELAPEREDLLASWIFLTAAILGGLVLVVRILSGHRPKMKDIIAGIILGIPNFFSIYFIQKMLTTDHDGSVIFPIHNIAILLLSAIASYMLFQERFSLKKIIGIVLAIVSIVFLSLGIEM